MDRQRKRELRELNARAWADDNNVFQVNSSLDSSLKKNTAFIKRLRTAIASSTLSSFLQDIRTLSLHKYLSEITSACYEGVCRLKTAGEISLGVEVISALHQRFGPTEFTGYLGWLLGRGLATPDKVHLKTLSAEAREKEERERLARQRSLLKMVTELWLVGVLRSFDDVIWPDDGAPKGKENAASATSKANDGQGKGKGSQGAARSGATEDAEPFPLEVLKDLLQHDREHLSLQLVNMFIKTYAWDVLGVKPIGSADRQGAKENGVTTLGAEVEEGNSTDDGLPDKTGSDGTPLTSSELQQRFRNVLTRYFEGVKAHIVRDANSITAQARRNAEAYVRSGEIFEDRQASYEKQVKAQEKLIADAQILSNTLGLEMPELKGSSNTTVTANGAIGLVNTSEYLRGQGEGAGIWEDEEERRFYENLIDLKDRVPGILLEDGRKQKPDSDETSGKKSEDKEGEKVAQDIQKEGIQAPPLADEGKNLESEEQSTVIINKTVGAKVDALLARLPELTSKDMVDELAIDFCFLNSKASRNRLLKALQEVPKGRADLLPFYGRLVASLGRYLVDISQSLVSYLDSEFRSLQRRKDKDFLGQVRTINIRYLAELTKFGVVPEHVIFHCLKVSLDDFSRMNIEIICNLLENCGRYLLRNPDTSPRMKSFLETLQRKKAAQHLGQQERMLIENAVYYVDPPERASIQRKERTPVDLFVRKLIYLEMNKKNYTRILKQIRKLHWEEQEVVDVLAKIFVKPGKMKHSNIHILAILAGALYRYHPDFVISVVDDVLESITFGLEQHDFKYNQRRIAEVKYLGELYNYKMVDSPVVFDTLYRIVTFGHEGGTPSPGKFCALDPPDDFFRIRLVCTLLETCGMCFDRGSSKKKLDFFLTFFQYYIYTKDPSPMDLEFLLHDTFSLIRPNWTLAADLEEASQRFADAVSENYKTSASEKPVNAEESPDGSSSERELDEDESRFPDLENVQSSSEEAEIPANGEPLQPQSDSEEEKIIVTRPEEERDPEADAEFDRELAKMTAESLDSRKFDRKPMFDVPLPIGRSAKEAVGAPEDDGSKGSNCPNDTMAFSLLTKKGNRQQTRTVALPADSNFAVALKTQQEAEREEQRRIKDLVLNYDMRDDGLDGDHILIKHQQSIIAKKPKGPERFSTSQSKLERPGGNRNHPRARKLQMNDMDWYGGAKPH